MTIQRHGDQMVEQITVKNKSYSVVEIYPQSETIFFAKGNTPHELTFIKNAEGEVTAVIERSPGGPVREGRKLKSD